MDVRYTTYEKVYDSDLEEHANSEEGLLPFERPTISKSPRTANVLSHLASFVTGLVLCLVAVSWRDSRYRDTCTDAKLRRSCKSSELFPLPCQHD